MKIEELRKELKKKHKVLPFNEKRVKGKKINNVYNNKQKVDNLSLDNYILSLENGFYKVYVGASFSLENSKKIKEIYKDLGNIIYIKEKNISNLEFIDYLQNNEVDFSNLTNTEILSIENNIINKYKEMFNE